MTSLLTHKAETGATTMNKYRKAFEAKNPVPHKAVVFCEQRDCYITNDGLSSVPKYYNEMFICYCQGRKDAIKGKEIITRDADPAANNYTGRHGTSQDGTRWAEISLVNEMMEAAKFVVELPDDFPVHCPYEGTIRVCEKSLMLSAIEAAGGTIK